MRAPRLNINRVTSWLYNNEHKKKLHVKFWDFLETGKDYRGVAIMEIPKELEKDYKRVFAKIKEADDKRAEEIRRINLRKSKKK